MINPAAGQEWKRIGIDPARRIAAFFQTRGHEVDLQPAGGPGDGIHFARQAVESGFDLLIAAGGDGTVNEAVNGLAGSRVALGVIPLGTENVLAREMRIPTQIDRACQFVLDTPPRRIDVGRFNERFFLAFGGIGLDAHVVARVTPEMKGILGSPAFLLTGVRLAWKYRKLTPVARLIVDDRREESSFWLILVANIATYGGGVRAAPLASVQDGLLDVCIFPKSSYSGIVRQILATFAGVHLRHPEIGYFQCKRLQVETEPSVMIQVDGEVVGETPGIFSIVPAALTVRF